MTWVTGKGGIRHQTAERPTEEQMTPPRDPKPPPKRTDRLTGTCADCGDVVDKRVTRCRECYAVHARWGEGHQRMSPESAINEILARLSRNLAKAVDPYVPTRQLYFCPDCNCALGRPDAFCPNCLIWAERDANRATWAAVEITYNPASTIWEVA